MAQAARETTIDLPTLTRSASFTPGSVDTTKRTVDMVWTTGAPVMRGYYNKYWETLSLDQSAVRMGRLNNGAPLLNAHNGDDALDVIGVVESARLGTPATATVRFAKADDSADADQIFRLVVDGILQNTSVGYNVYRLEQQEDAADGVPVFMATDWEPCELTVAPIAADDGAGFRSADKQPQTKCVFVTRQQGRATMATENESNPNSQPASGKPSSAAVEATHAARAARIEEAKALAEARQTAAEEATTAERARMAAIRRTANLAKLPEAWATKLIEAGTSAREAQDAAFSHMAQESDSAGINGFVRVGAGDDARDKFVRGASAWMFERAGMVPMLEEAMIKRPKLFRGEKLELDGGEFRGLRPVELARMALERSGVSTRGMDVMTMIGAAFTQTRGGAVQTAGDFPILLENVLGKVLLGAYALQSNTFEKFTTAIDVPDFRAGKRYRTGSLGDLDVIPEHGEYKTGVVPDGSQYPVLTQRMGKIFGISQETILNDDMGALTDQAKGLGQAAMRSIEKQVYALLLLNAGLGPTVGSAPFFDASRGNINATGSALSVFAIDADRVVMQSQKDPSGVDFIDLQPAVLLVPNTLKGTALEVNENQYDFDASGTVSGNSTGKFMRANRVRGLFREVVATPRLTGTRRYLFADTMDAIVIGWLEGYGRGPVLESQSGWRVAGVEWKVTIFAKAQMGDAKAAVTNAGV